MTIAPERPTDVPSSERTVCPLVEHSEPRPALVAMPLLTVTRVARTPRRSSISRLFGVYVAAAVITCYSIEPVPNGPDPDPGLWFDAVDLLALATFLVCGVLLLSAGRAARWAGLAAGIAMVVETATCPLSGHHMIMIGWWWWLQAGLSLVCVAAGAVFALAGVRRRVATDRLVER